MRINVLFIKRRFALGNLPEAYACHDEATVDENPDWPATQVTEMLKDCGSDMQGGIYQWIAIKVQDAALDAVMPPVLDGLVIGPISP